MFPSPSLGPPLLSESWSPPPFCGMPPADFCFEVVPEDEDEDEELLDGWLAGALEEPPPQAVTSAMTAPNMIATSRREVMDLLLFGRSQLSDCVRFAPRSGSAAPAHGPRLAM
jgi:hypothetical protein